MILETLKVENLLGCNYEIEFDPKYTVIIGNNRQGKTLTARLIMLALYGTGKGEKELHDSWKLRTEELLPTSDNGSVELVFRAGDKRYMARREFGRRSGSELNVEQDGSWKLEYRKDKDIKIGLEDEIGITPGLMNVAMSNEQSLIGAISYDDKLQASVWEGWKWRSEIIRGNIKKARDKCARQAADLRVEIDDLQDTIDSILSRWVQKSIFPKSEVKKPVSKEILEKKLGLIIVSIRETGDKLDHYSKFHEKLIRLDNLESKIEVRGIANICEIKEKFLDEKKSVEDLKKKCSNFSKTLADILAKGGRDGIRDKITTLEDEEKKLKAAKTLSGRKDKSFKAKCDIYPPSSGEKLIVQIPGRVAVRFKYEEIAGGGIAVPYDEDKEASVRRNRISLTALLEKFDREKAEIKIAKDAIREIVGNKKQDLQDQEVALREQQTILEGDKDRYLSTIVEASEKEELAKRLETAKEWFGMLHEALSEEETLRKIRKETVAFINRIYENVYGWDINAKLEDDERIVITDTQGKIRSHPSGSEIHIMGLAWRWMVTRGFNLPLVLDELDVLLDGENFAKTRKLIEEEMDRQTVILTLRESLKDLPGKVYKITRERGTSTLAE
jgi:hypothetical protein